MAARKLYRHPDPKIDREFENAYSSIRAIAQSGAPGPPGSSGAQGPDGADGLNSIQTIKVKITSQVTDLPPLPEKSFITDLWGIVIVPYNADTAFRFFIGGVEVDLTTVLFADMGNGQYTRFWPKPEFFDNPLPDWLGQMYFDEQTLQIQHNGVGGTAVVCLNYITTNDL